MTIPDFYCNSEVLPGHRDFLRIPGISFHCTLKSKFPFQQILRIDDNFFGVRGNVMPG